LLPEYTALQQRLARGWNTWDVNSVTTHVLLPQGLAIHVGLKHNATLEGDALLSDTLIGRMNAGAEQVFPGAHAWDGGYTDLRVTWKGHSWRVQSAQAGQDLVLAATPLPSETTEPLPPTVVFSVNFLWNRPGNVAKLPGMIEARGPAGTVRVYCSCEQNNPAASNGTALNLSPVTGPYFAADFGAPVTISTGTPRTSAEVLTALAVGRARYEQSLTAMSGTEAITDAIQTTLGWDTIFEPEKGRVVSPVSRVWSVRWGGYVIFDWDTFFAATMASIGDRDLAYADAVETLRESTTEGFVPNYARSANWKSFDRSEPPVGAITVLGLYRQFGDVWFLRQTFPALLNWNRWWSKHRDLDGFLTWGSDGGNLPGNLDDKSRGTRGGAILESGLDNSPMYDDASYNSTTHLLEFGDVGLMSLYIADSDALATIADTLHQPDEARELRSRSQTYARKLQTMWSAEAGIFLNKDLRTGQFSSRLSPTNFYPMLARVATPAQAQTMVSRHLLNPREFWGEWVIPATPRDDPAYKDQNYWRGRIWGPMNYLVYLGLQNYEVGATRSEFAGKSYALFLKEWREHGHVHENYNATLGTGDDVTSSDRFYHWGALLGYTQYLEQTHSPQK
jgi:putative isomerase